MQDSNGKPPAPERPRLQLQSAPPEALTEALKPQIEHAELATKINRIARQKDMKKTRERHCLHRLRAERENIALAGSVMAAIPKVLLGAELEGALDAILAQDDITLAEQRRSLGRHAKAKLIEYRDGDKPHLPRSRGRGRPKKKVDEKIEVGMGEPDWLKVYDAFRVTALPARIAELTELPVSVVEHLLELGIQRLNLPAIRVHASRTDVVHGIVKQANPEMQDASSVVTNPSPELEAAITSRAVRESAAAQMCLDAAIDSNTIFAAFSKRILEAIERGSIEVGEPIRMSHLEQLSKALTANTASLERAVKLSRLVRGQTTDLVGQQISLLLQGCSTEELDEAERTGGLPRRLINRFSGGDEGARRIIDVDARELNEPDTTASARIIDGDTLEADDPTNATDDATSDDADDAPDTDVGADDDADAGTR